MMLVAAARAAGDPGYPGGEELASMPAGQSAETVKVVLQSRRFGRDLQVTRSARRALAHLRAGTPDVRPGDRLGLILATDRGDQHVLAHRLADFGQRMQGDEIAPTDLFRAIAYFPVGRVLKSLADEAHASGPITAMPANPAQARAVAEVWLATGRADQVAVVLAEASPDGTTAEATAQLWQDQAGSRPAAPAPLAITSYLQRGQHAEGASCASMAAEVITELAPGCGRRGILIVGSMLADAGESLLAHLAPRDPGPPLDSSIRSLAPTLGFSEAFVLVGSSGATMTALALAQDLMALDRADSVVVCGVDLVHGALSRALGLLHCQDLPHLRGGAAALVLQRRGEPGTEGGPTLEACSLVSPAVPSVPGVKLDLSAVACPSSPRRPAHAVLSGLHTIDLDCAEQLATRLWPGTPISDRADVRSVGADVLRLAGTAADRQLPMGIAAVHSLGGTGHCVIS
ncbi:hypothetical protein [Jatrophihabitans sp.]|jgi:hypothetical protein|uniref:hypothetical protein n=1 Tax=Jatrophihabitans sp. TaxID=1932789 RepID=UPI002EECF791